MNAIGVLLLAAATSTGGLFGKPHVGGNSVDPARRGSQRPGPSGRPDDAPGRPGRRGTRRPADGSRTRGARSSSSSPPPCTSGGKRPPETPARTARRRSTCPAQLTVPARYNFTQGYIYRLKLTDIAGRPGLQLYPTIEVAPSTPATDAYLTHNPIPAIFTEEDFDQVVAGNFVTKVIYLPDPKYQELAVSGVETLVSTRLEPGVDPIVEADRRGTILMIVRGGCHRPGDAHRRDLHPAGRRHLPAGHDDEPDAGRPRRPGDEPDAQARRGGPGRPRRGHPRHPRRRPCP